MASPAVKTAAFLAWLLVLHAPATWAGDGEVSPGIWFGGTAGPGLAAIDHPELSNAPRTGGVLVLDIGWALSPRWAVGGEFTTWGTSALGTPVHLHTIGPRIELAPVAAFGLFARATGGLALTEGAVKARAGGAVALAVGYRWWLGRWTAISVEGAIHGHSYQDGYAILPFVATELRFYGRQD